MREDLLRWRKHRYGKWALLLVIASVVLFSSQLWFPQQPANGGTWQGYILGTVGALLIAWLSALGIRKRRYRSNLGTVQGWTSAHVYLGAALVVVATLHCAAQFGWNVHTLAYVLTVLVVTSGLVGLYFYLHIPGKLAENSADRDPASWWAELAELDRKIADVVTQSDAELQTMARSALEQTRLGGSVWQQLSALDRSKIQLPGAVKSIPNVEQGVILQALAQRIPAAHKQAEAEVLHQLLSLFGRRQVVLHMQRRDIRLRGLLKIWLYFHVPLTLALLVALVVHIFSVFIYW